MSPKRTRLAALLLGLPAGLLACAAPAAAQNAAAAAARAEPAPSTNAMVNLVRLLVAQGTIARDKGDALIAQALQEAAAARAAEADAHRALALVSPQAAPAGTATSATALAAAGAGAAAPAVAGATQVAALPAPAAGAIRVPYVPAVVRDQIRDEIKAEVLRTARAEGWAAPAQAAPEWTHNVHIYGDLRLRSQSNIYSRFNATDQPNFQALVSAGATDLLTAAIPFTNATQNQFNLMGLRARVGVDVAINPTTTFGFQFASGNNNAPISTSTTLGNGLFKRNLYLNKAYLEERFSRNAIVTVGRMDNPFYSTEALFNNELKFDGIAGTLRLPNRFYGRADFSLRAGAFPLDFTNTNFPDASTTKGGARQKWLFAGQIESDFHFPGHTEARLAAGLYGFKNVIGRPSAPCALGYGVTQCNTDWSAAFFVQQGNTLFPIRNIINSAGQAVDGAQLLGLEQGYHVLDVLGSVRMPVNGHTEVALLGEFLKNLAFRRDVCRFGEAFEPVNNGGSGGSGNICDPTPANRTPYAGGNLGWQVLATLGYPTPRRWGEWRAFLGYKYLQSDVVLDAFNDDTFHLGGTNARGLILGGTLGLTNGVTMTGKWQSTNEVSGAPYSVDVFQLDLNVSF